MCYIIVDGSIFDTFKKWLDRKPFSLYLNDKVDNSSASRLIRCLLIPVLKIPGNLFWWIKRKVLAAMNCYTCAGFWTGIITAYIMWSVNAVPIQMDQNIFALFLHGCVSSFVSVLAASIILVLNK